MNWSNHYIGIPFKEFGRDVDGVDCYGLAVLVYERELGLVLTSYAGDYTSCEERGEIDHLFQWGVETGPWHLTDGPSQVFDIALFRRGKTAAHCGIVVGAGQMLHIQGEDQAKIERYSDGAWKHRLIGHFRHKRLAGGLHA